jgi:hypothetical protein
MIALGETLLSEDVFDRHFVCNLEKCKGACCVEGDVGAPLDEEELPIIHEALPIIKEYMSEAGLKLLDEKGFYVRDQEEGVVTVCSDTGECVFVKYDEKMVTQCAIQLAYKNNALSFEKPISCHLYPIRLSSNSFYTVINYNRWSICNPACALGKQLNVPLYKFLETPLKRKFGDEWFDELCEVAQAYERAK